MSQETWDVALGSITPRLLNAAMTCGADQLSPPSVDFIKASWSFDRAPWRGVLGLTMRSVKSKSVPLTGSTTMMLPIV